jgi:hypothetical protein
MRSKVPDCRRSKIRVLYRSGTRQDIEQAAHPRRGDRQRPASRGGIQAQVKLTLPRRQPLPRRRLQQLQLSIVAGRADVLDIPRTAMGGIHDLHSRRARRSLHRTHMPHRATLRPGLVGKSAQPDMRTRRSVGRPPSRPPFVLQVRSLRSRHADPGTAPPLRVDHYRLRP